MKLNNKGFAITAVLYGLLILFVLLVSSYLLVLSSKKNRLDKITEEIEDSANNSYCDVEENDNVFEAQNASEYISSLFESTGTITEGDNVTTNEIDINHQLIKDQYDNIRYYGESPNNYIDIGDRDSSGNIILWRIIGVFKNIHQADDTINNLIKIIRSEPIGSYSWDISDITENQAAGINEWSQADLMKLLNPNYGSNQDFDNNKNTITVNNSLWYERKEGICFINYLYNNATTSCDFTSTGLSNSVKDKIEEVTWHLGGTSTNTLYPNEIYKKERGEEVVNPGVTCNETNCNDTVTRTTIWTGKIGLAYPSDYGYATDLSQCSLKIINYASSSNSYACREKNWMWKTLTQNETAAYFLTPVSNRADRVWYVKKAGSVIYNEENGVTAPRNVSPTLFLKSKEKIISGNGTLEKPYLLKEIDN